MGFAPILPGSAQSCDGSLSPTPEGQGTDENLLTHAPGTAEARDAAAILIRGNQSCQIGSLSSLCRRVFVVVLFLR